MVCFQDLLTHGMICARKYRIFSINKRERRNTEAEIKSRSEAMDKFQEEYREIILKMVLDYQIQLWYPKTRRWKWKVVETSYGKSREIIQCNTKDAAADELAKRIGGQSRSAFADDPIQREFDVISDQYIAQAKPPLKCVNKTVRTQMKATFEAAKKYERKVYYQFEGIPSQEVLDKLYEYSERYGVEAIIDTEPLGILN